MKRTLVPNRITSENHPWPSPENNGRLRAGDVEFRPQLRHHFVVPAQRTVPEYDAWMSPLSRK